MFSGTNPVTERVKLFITCYSECAPFVETPRGYHISKYPSCVCILPVDPAPDILLLVLTRRAISQFRETNTSRHRGIKSAELDHPDPTSTKPEPWRNINTGGFHTGYGIAGSHARECGIPRFWSLAEHGSGKTLAHQDFIHTSSYNKIAHLVAV